MRKSSKVSKWIMAIIAFLVISKISFAEELDERKTSYVDLERIVVTPTKTEEGIGEIGASVSVITSEYIERKGKGKMLVELLREIPGLDISRSGNIGGNSDVYIRGAKPGQTVVMIDGVEINDPISADKSFDFADIITDNIERVEIVRGPQSTLYGSDAIGGVINIITKRGEGKPKVYFETEMGSYNTFRESVGINGTKDRIDFSFWATDIRSDGFSKAANGSEDDNYQNNTVSGKLNYDISEKAKMDFVLRYTIAENDIDDGAFSDDPNYTIENRTSVFKTGFEHLPFDWWTHKLTLSLLDVERKNRDFPNTDDTFLDNDLFDGETRKFNWQHNFIIREIDTLIMGYEFERDRGSSETFLKNTSDISGYYAQNQLNIGDQLFVRGGARLDDHQRSGSKTSYKTECNYTPEWIDTRVKGSWGTGFKAPSLFQLYSSYGDTGLLPEESESYDLGIEQPLLNDKALVGITYFHNHFKQMINYDFGTNKYKNISKAKTKGVEATISVNPIKNLHIYSNYTFTKTKDSETGNELTRRPENKFNIGMDWLLMKKLQLDLSMRYTGSNWDESSNTTVKDYTVFDFSSSYNVNDDFKIFGRIENLFDKNYYEVIGFNTPGASFYGGIKRSF